MGNRVIIIGGGVAGMQAAITLDELGLQPILIEKEAVLGGKLNKWDRLFPTMTPAEEVLTELTKKVQASNTEVHTSNCLLYTSSGKRSDRDEILHDHFRRSIRP